MKATPALKTSTPVERRKLLVNIPAQRLKAGEVGVVLTDYPIAKAVSLRFPNGRYVTVRYDNLGPVEAES